jgi:O-antigen ligase
MNTIFTVNVISQLALGVYFFSLGMPFASNFPLVLLGLAGFACSLYSNNSDVLNKCLLIPLIAFVVATSLSIIFAIDVNRAVLTSLSWIPGFIIIYLTAMTFNRHALRRYLLCSAILMILISSFVCIEFLKQPIASPAVWMEQAGLPHLSVPNDCLLLAITAPCSCALFSISASNIDKVLGVLALFSIAITILLVRSNSALLVYMFSISMFLSDKYSKRVFFVFIGVLVLSIFAALNSSGGVFREFLNYSTWTSRIPLWVAAWSMFLDAPFLGHGPGSFSVFYESYLKGVDFVDWVVIERRHVPWAHNLYLELLAERGILGASAFIIFVLSPIDMWQYSKNEYHDREYLIFRKTIYTCIFSLFFAGLFEISILRHWVVIAFCYFIGLLQVDNNPSKIMCSKIST